MSVNVKDVFVGAPDQAVTGAILRGAEWEGAVPDTIDDFESAISGASDGGYVTEDGLNISPSESSESIKDWSLKVIRKLLTEFDATISWEHLSLDRVSAENFFGEDNVAFTPADASNGNRMRLALAGKVRPRYSWFFRMKDGVRRVLVFVPHGEIGERGEIPMNASAAVTLPVTLNTYPDAAGNNLYVYTDDGVVAAASPKGVEWTSALTGTPAGGTYILTVDGDDSDPIAHDANAIAVQSALNDIAGVSATVSGTTTKAITFVTPRLLTADGSSLTGGTLPDVVVTKVS